MQTSNHHHCNPHAHKYQYINFQVILSSSSQSKTTFYMYFLRNKYGFQIGTGMEKINSFDQEEMLKMA